jgi:hypothetical protein
MTSFFIVVLGGGTLWHLQNFLQCIKYAFLTEKTSLITLYKLVSSIHYTLFLISAFSSFFLGFFTF